MQFGFSEMSLRELQIWAPVVAALGASILTALATFGIVAWQARRASKNDLLTERRDAYARLLSVTGLMVHSAWLLRVTMDTRSGLGEGIDVAFRVRKPLDPFDLNDWMRRDLEPLYEAWSDLWTVGSKEAVVIGNEVVDSAGDVLEGATNRGEARGPALTRLLGEKWTDEQFEQWLELVDALGAARRSLADLARRETGMEIADFVRGSGDSQPAL